MHCKTSVGWHEAATMAKRGGVHRTRCATDAHHRKRPKREKENLKENTPITGPSATNPAHFHHPFAGTTNRRVRFSERCVPAPTPPEGARARAFTTKSPTTGLVSGSVPSAPHHVSRSIANCRASA